MTCTFADEVVARAVDIVVAGRVHDAAMARELDRRHGRAEGHGPRNCGVSAGRRRVQRR